MAATRLRVACTRLSRMRCFCAAVHRFAAIDSPARLTTASAPSIDAAHGPGRAVRRPLQASRTRRAFAAAAGPAREDRELVAVAHERAAERAAKEPRAAGNDDAHRTSRSRPARI